MKFTILLLCVVLGVAHGHMLRLDVLSQIKEQIQEKKTEDRGRAESVVIYY